MSRDINNMSSGGEEPGHTYLEFCRRRKIASRVLRRRFLRDCIEEQVLPRSAPKQLSTMGCPFSISAREYLLELCNTLTNEIDVFCGDDQNINLPTHLAMELERENNKQKRRLDRLLEKLCRDSVWNEVGRPDLINNLSSRRLTDTEIQALSMGLKFDVGVDRKSYSKYLAKNYRHEGSDVEKGFIQGILLCYKSLSNKQHCTLPRRYMIALKNLGKCEDIVISQADKGGGVVVMDKADYVNKMMDLLNDNYTYEKRGAGSARNEAEVFEKEVRKILRKSEKGKKLLCCIEENPKPPRMRGLPKTHKPGIPLRPITSGVGSAPHRLAKVLAKPLSRSLGTISNAHLRNSSDLLEKMKGIDYTGKRLVSFDVKSLFTNVPVEGALQAVRRAIVNLESEELPVNKNDYVKLVSLCVRFGAFIFEGEEFRQHRGLAMGSPLSAVMASLFMEVLETDRYKRIIGRGTTWWRYVDDILVVVPTRTDIDNKLRMLNEVDDNIQFTVETEEDGKIPFLDTLIHRSDMGVRFSVFRKQTNRDDFIHFLSGHSTRTKRGVVIGFFLRALRICSEEFLEDEFVYVKDAFMKLKYPEGLLNRLRKVATEIADRSRGGQVTRASSGQGRYVTFPHSIASGDIDRSLEEVGMRVAYSTGIRIGEMVKNKKKVEWREGVGGIVYQIPCNGCDRSYYGESRRDITTRINEHKRDIRAHRTSNSMVVHIDEFGHLPKWEEASILHRGLDRRDRKLTEAAYIVSNRCVNHREGFFRLASAAAEYVLNEARRAGTNQSGDRGRHRRGLEGGARHVPG